MKTTLHEEFENALANMADKNFIYARSDDGGAFIPRTYAQIIEACRALAKSLIEMGLCGKNFLILSENSYEWILSDFAVESYVGSVIGADKEWRFDTIRHIIRDLDIGCVLFSEKKADIAYALRECAVPLISMQKDLPSLIENGRTLDVILAPRPSNIMSRVVFTSGTTSISKAVMLSQINMFCGLEGLKRRAPFQGDERVFMFVPLHHTYGGIYNVLPCLVFGMELYICSDTAKLFEEVAVVKPTVLCVVPLILERLYTGLPEPLRLCAANGDERAISSIKAIFGGELRYLFCGGAVLKAEIRGFFKQIGLNLMDAYGLSETASTMSIEYSHSKNLHSAGAIFEEIDMKIYEPDENGHGEIIVRGDNVFMGYYKNDDATAAAIDNNGYFHTGDIGYIDGNNEVYILGRKDRIIVLSNGENVNAAEIEMIFMQNEIFTGCRVYLDEGKLSARLYAVDMAQDFKKIIDLINNSMPKYKRIRSYEVQKDGPDSRIK